MTLNEPERLLSAFQTLLDITRDPRSAEVSPRDRDVLRTHGCITTSLLDGIKVTDKGHELAHDVLALFVEATT